MNKNIFSNSSYLYHLIESYNTQLLPLRINVMFNLKQLESDNLISSTYFLRFIKAQLIMAERLTRSYTKPEFGINQCMIDDEHYKVITETVLKKPFCNLLHFAKEGYKQKQPKLLIIAPMAGHHATLLKSTVQDMLPSCDVYITDWIDAKNIPLHAGSFNMDDFIDYIIEYIKYLGSDLHVMAVCQPTVPALAAISILSSESKAKQVVPKSLILMAGPIDARKNATTVDKFALDHNLEWFKNTVITYVPPNYPGYMRKVYPGFLQLMGFVSLNIQKHLESHIKMFNYILNEQNEKATIKKRFYDEYFAAMDLPAEFYLQTIERVFQDFTLAKGKLVSKGREVNPKAITKCALLSIEGQNDDISGVGQTKAALDLCVSLPDYMKQHHLQDDVGHYGVFSGSKFRKYILPIINKFIYANIK